MYYVSTCGFAKNLCYQCRESNKIVLSVKVIEQGGDGSSVHASALDHGPHIARSTTNLTAGQVS